jgi:hypothetical protein
MRKKFGQTQETLDEHHYLVMEIPGRHAGDLYERFHMLPRPGPLLKPAAGSAVKLEKISLVGYVINAIIRHGTVTCQRP